MPLRPPFSESDLRAAVAASTTWADTLRFLGYEVKGANYRTIQRWAREWGISTAHFDPDVGRRRAAKSRETPLEDVMVENSPYGRGKLKRRLLATGMLKPICEMCGQGEIWLGARMTLVLDHINGSSNDHRLENLRMVCPNCAATLATHCGRNLPRERACASCGQSFEPKSLHHRYCSSQCWGAIASERRMGVPLPEQRKVPRPSYEQLLGDVQSMSMVAVGRKYGVSDNAVRKWIRWYENQQAREALESQEGGEMAA